MIKTIIILYIVIVDTIGSIDDLIEKYEEITNQLETLILLKYKQAITKVHKTVKLKDIVEVIDNRGKTPQLSKIKTSHPIIEVAHIAKNNMIVDIENCSKYVSDEVYLSSFRAGHLKSGDVLISTVGTIGEVGFNFEDGLSIAQNVVALRSKYSYLLYPYLILNKNELLNLNIGGVQPSIKIPHLLNLDFPLSEKYDSSIEFLYSQINTFSQKIIQLKKIKGELLNKYFNN